MGETQHLRVIRADIPDDAVKGLDGGDYAVIRWDQWEPFIDILDKAHVCDIKKYDPEEEGDDQ